MTTLSGKLPRGESNGLGRIAGDLVDHPQKVHVAVVLLDCSKVTTDIDSGDVEATARIRQVEVIEGQDKNVVARLLGRAMEERTGQTVLPFELEDEVAETLAGIRIDPETGEVLNDDEDSSDDDS